MKDIENQLYYLYTWEYVMTTIPWFLIKCMQIANINKHSVDTLLYTTEQSNAIQYYCSVLYFACNVNFWHCHRGVK